MKYLNVLLFFLFSFSIAKANVDCNTLGLFTSYSSAITITLPTTTCASPEYLIQYKLLDDIGWTTLYDFDIFTTGDMQNVIIEDLLYCQAYEVAVTVMCQGSPNVTCYNSDQVFTTEDCGTCNECNLDASAIHLLEGTSNPCQVTACKPYNPNPFYTAPCDNPTYSWDFGGDGTFVGYSDEEIAIFTYETGGIYEICLTQSVVNSTGTSCSIQSCETITLDGCDECTECDITTPDFHVGTDTQNSCSVTACSSANESYSTNCNSPTYTYDFGDGGAPVLGGINTNDPSLAQHTYAANGVYTICLTYTVINSSGDECSTETCREHTVENCAGACAKGRLNAVDRITMGNLSDFIASSLNKNFVRAQKAFVIYEDEIMNILTTEETSSLNMIDLYAAIKSEGHAILSNAFALGEEIVITKQQYLLFNEFLEALKLHATSDGLKEEIEAIQKYLIVIVNKELRTGIVDFDQATEVQARAAATTALSDHSQVKLLNNLAQNTAIQFETTLPEGNLAIALFNVKGERITTLTKEAISAGTYQYPIDKNNLDNGIYYIQVNWNNETDHFRKTVKLPVFR